MISFPVVQRHPLSGFCLDSSLPSFQQSWMWRIGFWNTTLLSLSLVALHWRDSAGPRCFQELKGQRQKRRVFVYRPTERPAPRENGFPTNLKTNLFRQGSVTVDALSTAREQGTPVYSSWIVGLLAIWLGHSPADRCPKCCNELPEPPDFSRSLPWFLRLSVAGLLAIWPSTDRTGS